MKELVAAAEQEGELDLNWGMNNPDMTPLIQAFNDEYPGIKVTDTPNQDQPANASKLIQESKAGRPSSTDVYTASSGPFLAVAPGGEDVLESIDWASYEARMEDLAEANNTAVTLFDNLPGLTYNSTQVQKSELPKNIDDILQMDMPVASTSYAAFFNGLGAIIGKQKLLKYLKEFEPAGLIGCGDLSRLASGEFAALWIACGSGVGQMFASQGAPLESYIVPGAAIDSPWYMGVPKNASHPEAAKLWVIWMTSPAAQKLTWEREFVDNVRIEGSHTAEEVAAAEAEGTEFVYESLDFIEKHHDLYSEPFEGEVTKALTQE
jgi:ABC-type Fe3+ transport system substrate-binding protein